MSLSKQLEPIGSGHNLAEEKEEKAQEDDAASETHAPSAKPKVALQPIVDRPEQEQLEQTGKATPTIIAHSSTP